MAKKVAQTPDPAIEAKARRMIDNIGRVPEGRESLPWTALVGDGDLRSCHDDCELPVGDMRTTY